MKRIAIIGSGGAGKSTLARKLGKITGITVYHLDRIFWKPGWVSISRDELVEKVADICEKDSWIIDGNYNSTIKMRMEAADTVIYLDFPTIVCLWGICKRRFMYKNKTRPDVTEGCEEKIDWEFFYWVLTYRRRNRNKYLAMLEEYSEEKNIVLFHNRRQVMDFMDQIESDMRKNRAFRAAQ